MTKKDRHKQIIEIISNNEIGSQDILLNMLMTKGFELTQATLSRDIKELKLVKMPTAKGDYVYRLSHNLANIQPNRDSSISSYGFIKIEFSGNLSVVKTRPGYAMGIASEIDEKISHEIIGTVAGDDTILLILREGITHEEVIRALSQFINIT